MTTLRRTPVTPASATLRTADALFATIRPGSRVTLRTPLGNERAGRAVMQHPLGWVLDLGGAHGTPGVVTRATLVDVGRTRVVG